MLPLTEATFYETVTNQPSVLVDFFATWCGPCNALTPVLERVAKQYEGQTLFAKVNTEENQALSAEFKINALPTMLLFKDGKPIKKLVGLHTEARIKEMLDGQTA